MIKLTMCGQGLKRINQDLNQQHFTGAVARLVCFVLFEHFPPTRETL